MAIADEARLEAATVATVFGLLGSLIGLATVLVPMIIWAGIAKRFRPQNDQPATC